MAKGNALMPDTVQFNPLAVDQQVAETQGLEAKNKLADLMNTQTRRAIADEDATRAAYRQYKDDPTARLGALASVSPEAYRTEADFQNKQTKDQQAIKKEDFDQTVNSLKWASQNLGEMVNDPNLSYSSVMSRLSSGLHAGLIDQKGVSHIIENMPKTDDPMILRGHLLRGLAGTLEVQKQIEALQPNLKFEDTGGEIQGIDTNPSSPTYLRPITKLKKTMSPEDIAADSRARMLLGQGKVPPGYRMTASGTLEAIPGGPANVGKALPGSASKELMGAGTAVENTVRLKDSFKDEYGGRTLTGDLSNTTGRMFGDDTGQAQWWQDMESQQNQTRHDLFGSALTKGELQAWEKTSITPKMDASQIRTNLARRAAIESRAASKLARSYAAAGYNQQQIRELLGTAAAYMDEPAPPVGDNGGKRPPLDAFRTK